jgi:hypothetical protein
VNRCFYVVEEVPKKCEMTMLESAVARTKLAFGFRERAVETHNIPAKIMR